MSGEGKGGQRLSVTVSSETYAYLKEMSIYHCVPLAEATRALIDIGRDRRNAMNRGIFPTGDGWIDDPRKLQEGS